MKSNILMFPFYRAMDAGAGGGGAPQGGTPYDAGAGGGNSLPSGGRQTTTAGGGGTPYDLKDDSLVNWDGKPTPWKDIRTKHFVPRTEFDSLRTNHESARTLLTDHAKRLDAGFAELERQRKAQGQVQQTRPQVQQPDIIDELESQPLVDGRTLAKLVKDLRANNLAPIANVVQQLSKQIKQQGEQLEAMRTSTNVFNEQHQSQQFDSRMTGLLKDLPQVKGLSRVPVDNPVIRELANDLWLSYDAKTWTDSDFKTMFAKRLEGLIELVTQDQALVAKDATERARKFFDPKKGSVHPSGQGGKYRHMNGAAIARESGLFGGGNRSTAA